VGPPSPHAARSVLRNTAFRLSGEVVAKLASIAFFVVIARELGRTGFGDFMFALSFTTLLLMASGFGSDQLLAREVARAPATTDAWLTNVTALRALTAVPLVGLAALIAHATGHPADVVAAVALVGTGVALENVGHGLQGTLQAHERMDLIAAGIVTQRIVTAAAGTTALMLGADLVLVAAIFGAGSLVGLAVMGVALARSVHRPRITFDRSRLWPILRDSAPIGLNLLLLSVLLQGGATLVAFLAPGDASAEVGTYAAAMRLVEASLFLPSAFTAAMLPLLARGDADGGRAASAAGGLKALTVVLLPVGTVLIVLAEPIITVLYGESFAGSVTPLRLLGASVVLFGLNAFASTVLVAADRPSAITRPLLAVAVVNVALNCVLIPWLGAEGAAIAALVSSLLLAALTLHQAARHVGALRLSRAFAGPVAAGAALAAVIVVLPGPAVLATVLGGVAYLAVLTAWERARWPDDLEAGVRLLRRTG
jgi:O-antigen/teichoic acid export membrane protein